MLPNLYWPTISLGPITIQVWGLFVALGILAGLLVARNFAKQRKLNPDIVVDAAFWIILSALVFGRLFFVVTEWSLFADSPGDIFKIWNGGISINGGFLGALLVSIIFLRIKKVSFWEYAEVMVYALPLGLFIGRLGCFFIFDHPGGVTDFFLGEVYYADGAVRHNHGLYLSINGLLMFLVFTILRYRAQARPPFFVTIFLIWYGVVRLWLDSDRILDSELYSLKAAQWAGIVMVIVGLIIFGQRQNIRKRFLQEPRQS